MAPDLGPLPGGLGDERSVRRYRRWYARILRLYPKPFYDRFGEGMEQTFGDLLRERAAADRGLFSCALWMALETSAGAIRENMMAMLMQNVTKRLMVWAAVVVLLLMIPLVAMQFTDEVTWSAFDFAAMGALLFGLGLGYELVARSSGAAVYRVAVGVVLVAAFLLLWVNGAVGIIGNEGHPANLMYFGVLAIGLIGAGIARLEPRGLSRVFLAMAVAQLLVPVIAIIAWPPHEISWGAAGVRGVFVLNAFFAAMFASAALLLRPKAPERREPAGRG